MNNRFKFRVWDVKNKKFLPESYFAILGNGKLIVTISGYYNDFTNTNQDDYVVQQYTGLTDKNGNLIFEGDIVQYNQNSSYDNMDFIAKWSDDKLGFIFQSNSGEQLVNQTPHLNRFKHLEVVGNIFEHSELLK
ncbi:hypothetical protein EB155_10380 [archaeon]|nr:hypothetical protein [archaeon]NDB80258.1 hypothetical protein [archaeon]